MKYSQKIPLGFTKTLFEFGDNQLDFMVQGEKADFGFSVPYEQISPSPAIKTVVEKWPLRVGAAIWIACILERIMDKSFNSLSPAALLFWALLACCLVLAVLHKRHLRSDALCYKTQLGNIIILNDKNRQAIAGEIETRRKASLKKRFGDINPLNDPASELAKLRRFKEDGILSEAEFAAAASQLSMLR